MKHFVSLLLCMAAAAQPRNGVQLAWPYMPEDAGVANYSMSASANWLATGFIATDSRQMSTVEVYINTVNGSPTSGDLRVCLAADSAGKPGTEIECKDQSGAPSVGWNSVSGWTSTASVTAGTAYWVTFRNMDATPASNNMSIQRRNVSSAAFGTGVGASSGSINQLMTATTTDSGTNWTRNGSLVCHMLTWTNGTIEGFPVDGGGTQVQIYSSREAGNYFLTGPAALRVIGATAYLNKNGTPTGSVRYRLYEGATTGSRTLVATTGTVSSIPSSLAFTALWFDSAIILKPNTWYALVVSETAQADTSSNRIQVTTYRVKSGSGQLIVPGIASDPQTTLYNGSTWSNTSSEWAMIAFILDRQPFVIPSGGFAITQ